MKTLTNAIKITALAVLTTLALAIVLTVSTTAGHEYGSLIGFLVGIGIGTQMGNGIAFLIRKAFPIHIPTEEEIRKMFPQDFAA